MDTEVTIECDDCQSRVVRPAHVSATGHVCINWPSIICRTCNGSMHIVDPDPSDRAIKINSFLDATSHPSSCKLSSDDDTFPSSDAIRDYVNSKVKEADKNWFTEEPDIQQILIDQCVLHVAKPECQTHRSGELYKELLKVIEKGGVVSFPDGRKFVIYEIIGSTWN